MKRKPNPEPVRPTDAEIRGVLRLDESWWNSMCGLDREWLRGIGTRELKRLESHRAVK